MQQEDGAGNVWEGVEDDKMVKETKRGAVDTGKSGEELTLLKD